MGLRPPPYPHQCQVVYPPTTYEWPWLVYCTTCKFYLNIYHSRTYAVGLKARHEHSGGRHL